MSTTFHSAGRITASQAQAIHDHGQHDPIEFVLSDTDQAIARVIRTEIRVHRDALNRAANDDHGPYTPAPAVAMEV